MSTFPTRTALTAGAATLAAAARVVARVADAGASADAAFDGLDNDDRSAVRAIALGTLRWYLRLRAAINPLLARTSTKMDPALHALLIVAAHQIEYSRNAHQGVVHAAVDAARALDQERAAGFVNAVLRRFLRERGEALARADADVATRHAHPRWFVHELRECESSRWERILEGNNVPGPMTLRVSLGRVSREAYLDRLAGAGLEARAVEGLPGAVVLETPVPIDVLPGFDEGIVSVQDAGAQYAALLLGAQPGMRVLDACAAPGGKTGHLLELAGGDLDLLAIDNDATRLGRVQENLDRLGLRARLAVADLRRASALADEAPFDRILVDAPCSSTGVIRRHPDIKLLRRSEDIVKLATTQLAILQRCFHRLAPGGLLLYATCSVLAAENADVVDAFVASEPQAMLAPLVPGTATWPANAEPRGSGMQFFPEPQATTDGFHYACLMKATSPARA